MSKPSEAQTKPTRLRLVEDIFHEALVQPVEARAALVKRRCGNDLELLRQVERLLAADTGSEEFLATPALGADFAMPAPESLGDGAAARRVGPYQLVRLLGSGGIGHVWLARRADEHFQKDVALKLIKRGMDTDAMLERFRQERQVLARLEHPHIARLIDGGATDDGLPYLVMEYVEGVPIDQYCREHRLGVEARLRLFLDVCSAVQYAHQNLVVHRDIKPGNILVVDKDSTKQEAQSEQSLRAFPKLLDFGIAKVLRSDASTPQTLTRAETRLLTPEYASPEQIRGEAITTASDVYSLGVLLYELLTDHRPHEAVTRAEFERWVCERDPLRPSTAVRREAARPTSALPESDPRRLAGLLQGDLDAILLKALSRDPADRYASAERFAEDIRRHLARLPVEARPPTVMYRTRRFVRRNLLGVAGALAFVLLLIVAAVTSTAFYFDALRQRDRAELALQQATRESEKNAAINKFIEDMLSKADRSSVEGRENVTVRETLDAASQRLLKGEIKYDAEVEADLRMAMGEIYLNLSLTEPALGHFRSALELRRTKFGRGHESVGSSLNFLGRVYRTLGRFAEAEAVQRESLQLRRDVGVEDDPYVAQSLSSLAITLRSQGKFAEAEPMYREALEIYRRKFGEVDDSFAAVLDALGVTLVNLGRPAEAMPMHKRALEIYRQRSAGVLRTGTSAILHNWAAALWAQGRAEEAMATGYEALETARRLHGPRHESVAKIEFSLARWHVQNGDLAEAEPLLRAASRTYRELLGDDHFMSADSMQELAFLYERLGRWAEAEPVCRDSLDSLGRTKPNDPATHVLQVLHGVILCRLGLTAVASDALAEGLAGLERAAPAECDPRVVPRLSELLDAWEAGEQACAPRALTTRWRDLVAKVHPAN